MCECGFELVWKRAYDPEDNYDGRRGGLFGGGIEADNPTPRREYLVCLNRRCRHCNVPLAPPRVELAPADPRMVAAVDAQIAREEEESRRLKARLGSAPLSRRRNRLLVQFRLSGLLRLRDLSPGGGRHGAPRRGRSIGRLGLCGPRLPLHWRVRRPDRPVAHRRDRENLMLNRLGVEVLAQLLASQAVLKRELPGDVVAES
jgi:hypothetical protein